MLFFHGKLTIVLGNDSLSSINLLPNSLPRAYQIATIQLPQLPYHQVPGHAVLESFREIAGSHEIFGGYDGPMGYSPTIWFLCIMYIIYIHMCIYIYIYIYMYICIYI